MENLTETQKAEVLIDELKLVASHEEIEDLEKMREDIIWSQVSGVTQDLWYETLGDAKKGLYF